MILQQVPNESVNSNPVRHFAAKTIGNYSSVNSIGKNPNINTNYE